VSIENPWIVRRISKPDASVRLFCFPHAGGGAVMYRDFHAAMPEHVEVCALELPGHLARRREPPIRDMNALVGAVSDALDPLLDRPFAFLGYSLGALVAFNLARALRARKGLRPVQLIAAAARGPHLGLTRPPISHEPRAVFERELEKRYGPIDPIIKAEPEMLEMVLEVTRADMAVLESHQYRDEEPLDCPLLAVGGTQDTALDREGLEGWRRHTSRAFSLHWLPGGHFFIRDAGRELIALARGALAA
jgi:medium-chain acyl-[acyl-carrier-protein] hydrolase